MKKVFYVLSGLQDNKMYEELARHWDRRRDRLEFVLLNTVPDHRMQRAVRARGFSCTTLLYRDRWPRIAVLWRLTRLLRVKRPDVVHVDLPGTPLLGLLAGRFANIGHLVIRSRPSPARSISGAVYHWLLIVLAHRITLIQQDRPFSDPHVFHDAR